MEWCNRTLIECPIHYALFTSEKDFRKALVKLGIKKAMEFVVNGYGATTHLLKDKDGDDLALVAINAWESSTLEQIYSLLAHEAVHIFQEIMSHMREDKPGDEFMAYGIQRITQNLIYAYREQVEKQGIKHTPWRLPRPRTALRKVATGAKTRTKSRKRL